MSSPLAEVRAASVGWGSRVVLRNVSFAIRAGDYVGLVGPNGSGKTTLLRALLGLSRPLAGEVVQSSAWRAGYVPQRDTLEPLFRFRADEVVAMAAEPAAWLPLSRRGSREAAAREALDAVGMSHLAEATFRDLSGGQKQRVLMARALAARPSVLVLDEPTTGLDLRAEGQILALVQRLRAEHGLAVVLVTHSLAIVADEVDLVGLLDGDGVRFGPPAEMLAADTLTAVYGGELRRPPRLPEDGA